MEHRPIGKNWYIELVRQSTACKAGRALERQRAALVQHQQDARLNITGMILRRSSSNDGAK